jgi:TatD DNase family protein
LEFIDSHCHFDFPEFDSDRDELWRCCHANGVSQLLIPGIEPTQWTRAAGMCATNPLWVYSAGLHPWWLNTAPLNSTELTQVIAAELRNPQCVAIGECGLDALIDTPMETQLRVLADHLDLAVKTQYPIILHCVKAHDLLLKTLAALPHSISGVIHGYSGSYEQAMQYWRMGIYIGIGGTITYPRAKKTRDAARRLPIEALLLETDAPAMPLHGQQGQRNSPAAIIRIAETLAELRGQPLDTLTAQTSHNFRRLFHLEK